MEVVTSREAESHMRELLARVALGETIAIADEGKDIAMILPASSKQARSEAAFSRMAARKERFRKEGKLLTIDEFVTSRDAGRP